MTTRYAHTNLVARNWKRLVSFYQQVFDCEPIAPERNLSGDWLDRATGLFGAHITGAHLRLPGYGTAGPTLEIFQYDATPKRLPSGVNAPGFAHIAFAVDDVSSCAQRVLAHGGRAVGELTTLELTGVGMLTFQYLADPEGNVIEVQRLAKRQESNAQEHPPMPGGQR